MCLVSTQSSVSARFTLHRLLMIIYAKCWELQTELRSQILNSSKHKIRHSRSPAHVAPAGTVLNNSNVFTTTTQTWVCSHLERRRKDTLSLRCLRSIISNAKEFILLNILILKLVENLGVNILFSSLVMINYVQ